GHILFGAGGTLRLDRKGIGGREYRRDALLSEFLEIYVRRAAVSGILFVADDRKLVHIDQRMGDLMKENEPHSVEHLIVRILFAAAVAAERPVKVLHQFVTHRDGCIVRVVVGVYLFTIFCAERYVLGKR